MQGLNSKDYIRHLMINLTLNSEYSIYEITQILRFSAFDKTPISDLIANSQVIQNDKDMQDDVFAGMW